MPHPLRQQAPASPNVAGRSNLRIARAIGRRTLGASIGGSSTPTAALCSQDCGSVLRVNTGRSGSGSWSAFSRARCGVKHPRFSPSGRTPKQQNRYPMCSDEEEKADSAIFGSRWPLLRAPSKQGQLAAPYTRPRSQALMTHSRAKRRPRLRSTGDPFQRRTCRISTPSRGAMSRAPQ